MAVEFRVLEQGSSPFQQQVRDKDLTAPPGGEAKGWRFIVGASATGLWSGHDDEIAWYTGSGWEFDVPEEGWICWINDEDKYYKYNGAAWEIWADINDLDDVPDGTIYGRVKLTELIEGQVERLLVAWPITNVNIGADEFVVAGDETDKITATDSIKIHRSTGNNATWTVSTVTYSASNKETTIAVVEDVTDATVDGVITEVTSPVYVTGEQARNAYDRRGAYDPDLKAIIFELDEVT